MPPPIIIIISDPPPDPKRQDGPEENVYDMAIALVEAARLANTPIVFQPPDHTPQDELS